jgi:hypothetical protein
LLSRTQTWFRSDQDGARQYAVVAVETPYLEHLLLQNYISPDSVNALFSALCVCVSALEEHEDEELHHFFTILIWVCQVSPCDIPRSGERRLLFLSVLSSHLFAGDKLVKRCRTARCADMIYRVAGMQFGRASGQLQAGKDMTALIT